MLKKNNLLSKYGWRFVFGVTALTSLLIFLRYSIVVINISNSDAVDISISATKDTAGKDSRPGRAGVNLVRRGKFYIEAASKDGAKKSGIYSTTNLFFVSKDIELYEQKLLQKFTRNGVLANCFFGDVNSEYYYCSKDRIFLARSGAISDDETLLLNSQLIGSPSPYKEGILSFVAENSVAEEDRDATRLSYVSPSGESVVKRGAGEYLGEYESSISTDKNSLSFVISNPSKHRFWVFPDATKTPFQYDLNQDLPRNIKKSSLKVVMRNERIIVSYTLDEPGDDEHTEGVQPTRVVLFGFNKITGEVTDKKVLTLPEGSHLSSELYVHENVATSLDITDTVHATNINSGKPAVIANIPSVDTLYSASDALYMLRGDELYRINPDLGTVELVSRLPVLATSLTETKNGLIISGPQKNTNQVGSFVLSLSESKPVSTTLVDVLPYPISELPILKSDYIGSRAVFNLRLDSYRYVRDTYQETYSQTEFDLKRDVVLRRLKRDGIELDKFNFQFLPTP